jgi:hypothetical protein
VLAVKLKLVLAEGFDRFAPLSGAAVAHSLGVSRPRGVVQPLLQVRARLQQRLIAEQSEMQFRGSHTGVQLNRPLPQVFNDSGIHFFDAALQPRNFLVGFVEEQLLLPLEVSPQPQYCL